MVFPGTSSASGVSRGAGSFNRFTFADVEKLQEATLLSAVSSVVRSGGQIIGGSSNWNTSIFIAFRLRI